MRTALLVAAAGSGRRMSGTAKPLLEINGTPVIIHTLEAFKKSGAVDVITIVCRETESPLYRRLLVKHGFADAKTVEGGAERQDSVYNGLESLRGNADRVIIHDAVRPFVDNNMLSRVIEPLDCYDGVVTGVPVKDTLKVINEHHEVEITPERSRFWAVQTPQAFNFDTIYQSHLIARQESFRGTDDAVLLERRGIPVLMVEGSYDNIKLTTPEDIAVAEAIWAKRSSQCV